MNTKSVRKNQSAKNNRYLLFHGTRLSLRAVLLLIITTALTVYLIYLDRRVVSAMEGTRWNIPSKIYSDSTILYPGISVDYLKEKLSRLGYLPARAETPMPGEYQIEEGFIDVYLREFKWSRHNIQPSLIRILINEGKISMFLKLPSKEELYTIELEPELIAGVYDKKMEERELIDIKDAPQYLIQAIISVEDARFYSHHGIDPRGLVRALWINLREWKFRQGGSTITQQLVKNFFLTGEKNILRKIKEALMAVMVEIHYSKDKIMEAYLNEIYLGVEKGINICGVKEAAEFYFSKPLASLTLSESALLAAIIRSPGLYNPFQNPDRALERRNLVLDTLKEHYIITPQEAQEANYTPLGVIRRKSATNPAPYFTDYMREQIKVTYSEEVLTSKGLQIFTTLDADLQRIANQVVAEGLEHLEKKLRIPASAHLQAALITIEPQTGFIRAMVGGRDYSESFFNRATKALRQPGSIFKPIVYLAAMEAFNYTPSTIVNNIPKTWDGGDKEWSPQGSGKKFPQKVTIQTALENSLNLPVIHTAEKTGIKRIVSMARRLGITSPLREDLSLAIGGSEVTPMEMAYVYQVLAGGGQSVKPAAVIDIISKNGDVLEHKPFNIKEVIPPAEAAVMTRMLEGTVERGTATIIKESFSIPIAAKTGTTNLGKDAWFVGYTPQLLTLIWVGSDDNIPLNLSGSSAALPLWKSFMSRILKGKTAEQFLIPEGVVEVRIDVDNGMIAKSGCPKTANALFIKGTEPTTYCPEHGSSFIEWFKNIFRTDEK